MKVARILKMIRAVRFLNKLKQLEQKDASVCLFGRRGWCAARCVGSVRVMVP